MRILLQAELLYDFAYRSTSQFVAIDGGLTGSRLAALQVHDTPTKVSTLESVVAIGPHFTLATRPGPGVRDAITDEIVWCYRCGLR